LFSHLGKGDYSQGVIEARSAIAHGWMVAPDILIEGAAEGPDWAEPGDDDLWDMHRVGVAARGPG